MSFKTLLQVVFVPTLLLLCAGGHAADEEASKPETSEKAITMQLAELINRGQKQLESGKFEAALAALEQAKALAAKHARAEVKMIEARIQRVHDLQAADAKKASAPQVDPPAAPGEPKDNQQKPEDLNETILSQAECIEIAIQNNLTLHISRLNDRASDLDLRVAWSRYLPNFNLNLNHSGSRGGENHSNSLGLGGSITQRTPIGTQLTLDANARETHPGSRGNRKFADWGVSLRQPLWKGAGFDVGLFDIRSARLTKLISRGELELDAQDLIFQVKSSYANCIRQLQTLEVNERAVESAERFLRLTEARERAGQVTKLDVFNAEVQKGNREENLIRNTTSLENAFDLLKVLMDVDLEEALMVEQQPVDFGERKPQNAEKAVIRVDDENERVTLVALDKDGKAVGQPKVLFQAAKYDKEAILKDALENRIELINSRRALALQKLRVLLNKDGLGHQIDLTAAYDRSNQGSKWPQALGYENHNYSVGLQLSIPWGKVSDKAAYERTILALQRTEIQLKRSRTTVHLDVRTILRRLKENQKSILIQGKTVEQAKRSVEAARISFERGLKDSFDVIRAEDNLLSAKTDFINRLLDYVVRQAELEVVIGRPTGRIDLSADSPGGSVESRLPESLNKERVPKRAPDADPSPMDDPFEYRK